MGRFAIDIKNKKFGRLLAIKQVGKNKYNRAMWLCKCDCGNEIIIIGRSMRVGDTRSCGCLLKETATKLAVDNKFNFKHGDRIRDGNRISEYSIWISMKQRCYNPKHKHYKYYGGRGIKVYKSWREDYRIFLTDMERRPSSEYSIERIDNDGDYTPNNCRWATSKEQANNRRMPCRTQLDSK